MPVKQITKITVKSASVSSARTSCVLAAIIFIYLITSVSASAGNRSSSDAKANTNNFTNSKINQFRSMSLFDRVGNPVVSAGEVALPLSAVSFKRFLHRRRHFLRSQQVSRGVGPLGTASRQYFQILQGSVLKEMRTKPKFMAVAVAVSSVLSYKALAHALPIKAQSIPVDPDVKFNVHTQKMNPGQVVTRTLTFWKKATPIIAHYKFIQTWLAFQRRRMTMINRRMGTVSNEIDLKLERQHRDDIYDRLHERYAPIALEIILEMRGLFIKIGQVMSSRPDFIPKQYCNVFNQVQDSVPPWDVKEIESIISDSLRLHDGLAFDDVFDDFEADPIGSASIGQVHEATLKEDFLHSLEGRQNGDSGQITRRRNPKRGSYPKGQRVAVKVMHPDAKDRFRNDFRIFKVRFEIVQNKFSNNFLTWQDRLNYLL